MQSAQLHSLQAEKAQLELTGGSLSTDHTTWLHLVLSDCPAFAVRDIRECDSTFYVGLAHAAPPAQYKSFTAFSTNWLPEGSTLTYTCKEQRISRLG